MSLPFNAESSDYKGIVQIYEKECGLNRGDVSENTDFLKEFTADANLAMDDFLTIALKASGTWQFDDSNHEDYPVIYADLEQGTRDYAFTEDEGGNLVLEIFRVFIKDQNGTFVEIYPIDVQTESDTQGFTDGLEVQSIPYRYDKTANGVFLDPVPSYSSVEGLKVYVSRETSYFTYTDTTKKPGVPGIFHKYFALKPALDYARRNLPDDRYQAILKEIQVMEDEIDAYFGKRQRDERMVLKGKPIIYE